jgi:maleylacetoacetate isomerase
MKLYGFFRSSAAFRVRIALNLKGLAYEQQAVHLLRDGGEQHRPEFRRINPQGLVPVLVDGAVTLTQSLAIIEYLEETHPEPALLPDDAPGRARVRSLALIVACEIHPLNNPKVLKYLGGTHKLDEAARAAWYRHWIAEGMAALEARLAGEKGSGAFCHGDRPGIADCFLVPQIFNAKRYDCDLAPYPTVMGVFGRCMAVDAFERAAPMKQPDAEG